MVASNLPEGAASDAPDGIAELARLISDKKRAANRANARKSTGPRTDAGKKIASLNATKHGVHAKAALLPGEDPAELAALDRGLRDDLRPVGMMQELLVERIVSVAWKLRRIAFAEEAALDIEQERCDRHKDTRHLFGEAEMPPARGGRTLASDVTDPRGGRLANLLGLELKLQRAMQQAVNLLLKLKKERPAEEAAEAPALPARVVARDAGANPVGAEVRTGQNEATANAPEAAPDAESAGEDNAHRQNEATAISAEAAPGAESAGEDNAHRQNEATVRTRTHLAEAPGGGLVEMAAKLSYTAASSPASSGLP